MILSLSLDFVSNENTLIGRKPDKYKENGIINWNSIGKYEVNRQRYKTIFPSCSITRSLFHKAVIKLEHKKRLLNYTYRHGNTF